MGRPRNTGSPKVATLVSATDIDGVITVLNLQLSKFKSVLSHMARSGIKMLQLYVLLFSLASVLSEKLHIFHVKNCTTVGLIGLNAKLGDNSASICVRIKFST